MSLASGLANNTSADGVAHWVNRGGQQRFLVEAVQSEFNHPTPQSSLYIIRLWARHSRLYQTWTLWVTVYRFWCKFAEIWRWILDRLRAVVRCLDKMLWLISNNIPLTTILAKVPFLWKRLLEESMVARLALRVYRHGGICAEPRY